MAYILSKFNMPSKSGAGLTASAWADLYLDNLASAFTAANAAWSVYSQKETIGTNTSSNYGTRTLQLYSSASQKYVRIWCFSDYINSQYVSQETGSGENNNIKIYLGNTMRVNGNDVIFSDNEGWCEIYFGVSDTPIGNDFGEDLGLSVGLFGLFNKTHGTGSSMLAYSSYGAYYYGATISVITDGKMFGILRSIPNDNYINGCYYAPDMIVCANANDTNTEGVISTVSHDKAFYLGNNDPYNVESYSRVIFNAADGTRDFRGWSEGLYSGKEGCIAAESATQIPCTAIKVFLNINTYSGSDLDGIADGISLKGWVNPKYIRSANINVLPVARRGLTYANGEWLCTDAGTLVCSNPSNESPFDAAQ